MFNHVKELLTREGFLSANTGNGEIHAAMGRWIDMIEDGRETSDGVPRRTSRGLEDDGRPRAFGDGTMLEWSKMSHLPKI